MMNTGQRTKKMYVPAYLAFGELEITAIAPAQETEDDCENLKLDYIREQILQQEVADLDDWELRFLRHLKAGDDDMAWTEANQQAPTDQAAAFERLIGGNLFTIEIKVPV